MIARRWRAAALLAALLAATAAQYLRAGLAGAYLAADDFQWLAGGHTFTWARISQAAAGDHFYRPMIDVWFAGATAGCGFEASCYHLATLGVHLLNVALVFALGLSLFKDLRIVVLGTLLFVLEPAYTQAVVWVSAVTGLMAALFYLTSLLAQVRSWSARSERHRTLFEVAAVLLLAAGLFSHETVATLPVISWMVWRQFGPRDLQRRRTLVGGALCVFALFALATVVANRRNALFTGSGYTLGMHALDHAIEYLASMYVGPADGAAYAGSAIAIGILLIATPFTRFGVVWLLLTMVPYLWFTTSNTSRYMYLPSIGFAWAIAAAVAAAADRLATRSGRGRRRPAELVFALAVAFVAIRFGRFSSAAIRGHVQAMEPWRAYAATVAANARPTAGNLVYVVAPDAGVVDAMYIEPMVRWIHRDYDLVVVAAQ